jgi:hypothetical protein
MGRASRQQPSRMDIKTALIDLAKYPLAVLSVFLALVGAKFILGIPFGSVSEITTDGVKFSQEAKGEIASLSAQVNGLSKAVEELRLGTGTTKPLSVESKSKIFEASQTVSNQTAELTAVGPTKSAPGEEARGYIWVGDYDSSDGKWTRIKLVSPTTNASLSGAPTSISAGSEYAVGANMVLRDGLPRNDGEYFQGRKSIGIIPTGTRVRILGVPTPIDREFAVQYWVQVAVLR